MNTYCTCEIYTGTERSPDGVKVCERCGKPFESAADEASTERMLDFILSDPSDPRYAHMYDDGLP